MDPTFRLALNHAARTIRPVLLLSHALVALASYFLGSVPTGFIVGRIRGIDIREVGSGNIGATNAFRALGRTAGVLVLVADALKGFLACTVVAPALDLTGGGDSRLALPTSESLAIVAGLAAVVGHNYTCWLRFKGGKGVATSAGVLAAWVPRALLICVGMWCLVFAGSRYVSLASIVAAVGLPFAVWFTSRSETLLTIAVLLSALAVYRHRANIRRLVAGTEPRFHWPGNASAP